MKTIATICARGGSVGVPGKNILPLAGIPLIAHTIKQALSSRLIDAVYVSTDSPEIADVAKQFGAQVPFIRPSELATNTAAKIPVIQHLANWVELNDERFDRIVDLDPTSPLRNQQDIEACINLLDSNTDAVITTYESDKNPYFNMVEKKPDGNIGLVCNSSHNAVARQLAPKVYSMNASIYVWHRHTLEKGLWSGRLKMHIMPRERSIDIDSPLDLKLVELLIKENGYERDD
jgi:CMP-N,N'-diacetyllegionaminic acid synthase